MGSKCLRVWLIGAFMVAAGLPLSAADLRLVEAVEKYDIAVAEGLLLEGVSVNDAQPDGMTALHWAVRWDQLKMADMLLSAGADVNAANRYGIVPLALACTNGNAEIVTKLLGAGAKANLTTPNGETLLMTAARTGNTEVVTLLLDAGAEVNATEQWRGQTALMWAAAEKNAAAVQRLIERGADVSARSNEGMTALLFAARSGDFETVRTLLSGGASIHETAEDGLPKPELAADTEQRCAAETTAAEKERCSGTAARGRRSDVNQATDVNRNLPGSSVLATAILNAHYELGAWLIDEGAAVNVDGPSGTALHVLMRVRNCEFSALPCQARTGEMDSLTLAKKLLAHGADVNARMTQNPPKRGSYDYNYMPFIGATPLFLAAKASDEVLMRLLLKHGADLAIGNKNETTPLLVSAGIGYVEGQIVASEAQAFETVRILTEHGADVNAVNLAGQSAMHGVAYRGANSIAEHLSDLGAKLDFKDDQGRMPVNIADGARAGPYFRAHDETAALLRELMGPAAPPRATSQGSR